MRDSNSDVTKIDPNLAGTSAKIRREPAKLRFRRYPLGVLGLAGQRAGVTQDHAAEKPHDLTHPCLGDEDAGTVANPTTGPHRSPGAWRRQRLSV